MALQHVDQIHLSMHQYLQRIRRRRRRQRRRLWQQPWVSRRKQFGLYDQLLVELRQEDQSSFRNFMRMPVEMYTMKFFRGSSIGFPNNIQGSGSYGECVVVENFRANSFRILLSTIGHSPSTVRLIVKTCIILHNLMRIRYPGLQDQQIDCEHPINRNLIPGAWRQGPNLQDTQNVTAANIDSKRGNLIKHWINSPAGSVAWQDRMIRDMNNN
ncbi:unnamed protein product [Mytilus coruscus]|uniref:DDE Tnp4 domain-containing protein n=1 Tax=Mytilus coruscus TaxID=42192 RepID=A0A6J8EW28_MYTCO|nr:unnamed protein product [Mytilus coruscus]